ncbi:phosphatase PAP2 family protein [Psychroflexus tropicus]|uniref:phosphatase PAP2 family protein n=1 Tax=Psychroflexus tropicus TaxID=197345 RepID=UPI00036CB2E2|nr:phosphatase PAP2 family protein [Psychroflexus tropicus]
MKFDPSQWDWELMVYLNNLSPDVMDPFWSFITYTKHWIPFFIFLIILFFYRAHVKKSLLGVVSVLVCVGLTHLATEFTKFLVERKRPNATEELMELLKVLYEPSNFSFFSGHASTSFAATVFIFLTLKSRFKHLGLIFIWPVLFSLSRVFVGVHFPSDIIVGAFVGTLIGIFCTQAYFYLEEQLLSISDEDYA